MMDYFTQGTKHQTTELILLEANKQTVLGIGGWWPWYIMCIYLIFKVKISSLYYFTLCSDYVCRLETIKISHIVLYLQFSSVAQSCPTLCDPMNRSTPGLSVHHQLPEFTQTHVHQVRDTIQPSHPLSPPSPPAPNPSQHQSLFQRVNSSHEVAKVLEFQL